MQKSAPTPEPTSPTRHRDRSQQKPLSHVPLRAADAKRSVENILRWNSYLPVDCVRTMVRMGWGLHDVNVKAEGLISGYAGRSSRPRRLDSNPLASQRRHAPDRTAAPP